MQATRPIGEAQISPGTMLEPDLVPARRFQAHRSSGAMLGLIQADGEGCYDGDEVIVALE